MFRHLDKEMRRKLKESMKTEAIYNTLLCDCLADPEYLHRVCNATNSAKPYVYFKDTSKDEWQHLFAIIERNNILQLEMRPSTSTINAHNRSCNVKIVVSYDKNRNLVLSAGKKDDLRSHFI